MTSFDCLNTELLFEIFDYLTFTDLFLAFFNLQQRLNNTIRAYPSCIDLRRTTDRNALTYGPFLCRTLIVMGTDSEEDDITCLSFNFEAIRAIEFSYVNFTTLQSIFEKLPMQQLESITIDSLTRENTSEDMDQQIWSTIAIAGQYQLRYLNVSLQINHRDAELLLFDLPNLQHAVLKHISFEKMLAFVHHTPNLCSFTGSAVAWDNYNYASGFHLPKLTHLDLHIQNCSSFEQLRGLLSICPNLTHITLRFWISGNNERMIDATEWQILIEKYLPCLIYLKIRLFRFVQSMRFTDPRETFDQSKYWLERQPEFDIQVE